MNDTTEINLDTSALLNFVYSKLPGDIEPDKGCQRLIETPSFYCVIGPKANGEFEACCERRYDLYEDLLDWLTENPDSSIYDYDPTQRDVRTSSNDIDHIRLEIQHGWASEPRRKQLSDLRRCKQDIGTFQERVLETLLDSIYEELDDNDELVDGLDGLGLNHDVDIIVDAVEICREDEIDILVAVDSDITEDEQIEAVNGVIESIEGSHLLLEPLRPQEVP